MDRSVAVRRFGPFLIALVFLAAGILAAAEKKPAVPPPQPVVFCAYNVRNWLVMDRFENGVLQKQTTKAGAEKQAVIQTLTTLKPDIIGLSEIGTAADLAEIQTLLRKSGIDLPHSELAQGGDADRRLGLLSRFPITARQSQSDLTYEMNGRTMFIQRGILDVTLSLREDFPLRCLGIHFKSKREVPGGDQALMRRNEAALLRKHLDSILEDDPAARLLLYGDFNEYRNEPAIKAVQGSRTGPAYLEDLRPRDTQDEVWTHYWATADLYSRLDYLFVSRALKPFVWKEQTFVYRAGDFEKASDHRPVVTTLLVPATKP